MLLEKATIKRHADVTHIVVGCWRVGFYFIRYLDIILYTIKLKSMKKLIKKLSFLFFLG